MSKTVKFMVAIGLVLAVIPLSIVWRGSPVVVETAKGRPLVPVVQDARPEDREAIALAQGDLRVAQALADGRAEFVDTLRLSKYLPGALSVCAEHACRQVEFFNYTRNVLVIATVDLTTGQVVTVVEHPNAVPEPNRAITDRAQDVALADALVQAELGAQDVQIEANMAPENAWLLNSSCDTPHWCVALTYRVTGREGTLVVFVDLNDNRVAGVRWTDAPAVPEQNLPRYPEAKANVLCGDDYTYSQNGWALNYEVQDNDALHVWNVTYNGRPVFQSAKMVQVDVGYANQSWGYHDSVGCSAIVPAYPSGQAPVITAVPEGFELTQDFRMGGWGGGCAYRYQQWFTFYNDGRVRVRAAAFGRGCSTDGVYTPFLRVDMGPGGASGNTFQTFGDAGWVSPTNEGDFEQPVGGLRDTGPQWRVLGADQQGFELEPRWGGNMEPGAPDSANLIMLAYHAGLEGDQANFPSTGSGYGCPGNCFPRQWMNSEPIQNADTVLWYAASAQTIPASPYYCWTLNSATTYPCFIGPMFAPVNLSGITPTVTPSATATSVATETATATATGVATETATATVTVEATATATATATVEATATATATPVPSLPMQYLPVFLNNVP